MYKHLTRSITILLQYSLRNWIVEILLSVVKAIVTVILSVIAACGGWLTGGSSLIWWWLWWCYPYGPITINLPLLALKTRQSTTVRFTRSVIHLSLGHHTTANPYNCRFFVLGSLTKSRVSLNVRVYIDITLHEDNGRNHLWKCVTTNACRSINVSINFNKTSHTSFLVRNFGQSS